MKFSEFRSPTIYKGAKWLNTLFIQQQKILWGGHCRKYWGVDEDYVNNEENAHLASLSQSRNLDDMAPFPGNFLVIRIDDKFLACFLFPRKLCDVS